MNKKVCIITGNRAEYDLLKPIALGIENHENLQLQLIVTGSHLNPEYGFTVQSIEKDFDIDKKVDIRVAGDSRISTAKSIGLAYTIISEALSELSPNIIVLLGDRFETFAIAGIANILNIPIAHLHGGEITEGAFDESMRHAITKLSHLHFTSTEAYRKRVIQMGEQPDKVFHVGAIGVEQLKKINLLSKSDLELNLNIDLNRDYFVITYHPETLGASDIENDMEVLFEALTEQNIFCIFTKANCDPQGRLINKLIENFVKSKPELACLYDHLGQLNYLSLVKYCTAVVGNSSSGIIEVPSLNIPTINIGNRQKGRISADSVLHCKKDKNSIRTAFNTLNSSEFKHHLKHMTNPYDVKSTCSNIIKVIDLVSIENLIYKPFHDLVP